MATLVIQLRGTWKSSYKITRHSMTRGLKSARGFMGSHMGAESRGNYAHILVHIKTYKTEVVIEDIINDCIESLFKKISY